MNKLTIEDKGAFFMADKKVLVTEDGYNKLVEKLNYLKSVKRIEIADRLKAAIALGDLSENSEYDDAKNEPFCKFKTVEDGYEYHSTFLLSNKRYASLFNLDPTDYEAWAKGLKKAGYATNPRYADMLIRIIEENHLDIYDVTKVRGRGRNSKIIPHKLYVTSKRRGLKYIRARADDDLSYIAKEFDVTKRQLRSWNDLHKKAVIMEGDIIYLQPKHKKADKKYPQHVVRAGESLHSISQMYGVRVSSLIKRNKLATATVQEGQVLKLR